MSKNTTLQILRTSNRDSTTVANSTLNEGELLFDSTANKLLVGTGDTVGNAVVINKDLTSSDNITVGNVTATGLKILSANASNVKIGTTKSNSIHLSNASFTNATIANATINSLNIPTKDDIGAIIATIGNIQISSSEANFQNITIHGSAVATEGYVSRATSAGTGGQIDYLKIGQSTYTLPKVSVTSTSGSTIYNLNINGTNYSLPQGGGTAGVTSIGGKTGAIGTSTDIKVDSSNNLYLNSVTNVGINCPTETATFDSIVVTSATINAVLSSPVVNATTVNATTIKLTNIASGGASVSSTIGVRNTDGITVGLERSFLYSTDGQTEERIPTVKVLNIDPSEQFISSSYAGIFTLAIDGNKWKLVLGIGSTSVEIGRGGW